MNKIYSEYMPPPEPPEKLWLNIDYSKINFKDMNHVKFIYASIPETYDTLNEMYKVYQKNKDSYLKITGNYQANVSPPKIMKKAKGN